MEDDFAGEIPREVQALATQFAGLPQGEIAKIFCNKSRPINLYKLRHLAALDRLAETVKPEDDITPKRYDASDPQLSLYDRSFWDLLFYHVASGGTPC